MKDKYDKQKRLVIDNDLLPFYKTARKKSFFYGDPTDINLLRSEFGVDVHHACQLLYQSEVRKYLRVRKKMEAYVMRGRATFGTFTFRPDVLESTSEETRRVYMRRWLKEVSSCYTANEDFGDKTGREHYHAIFEASSPTFKPWPYGFMYLEPVAAGQDASKAVSHYIVKLTRHALKKSTKGDKVKFPSLIVSRVVK